MDSAPSPDRGQSQISTLIIFIGIMLIATMTAGVAFDLTGSLLLRSEDTGERSNDQVVDRLEPIATVGVLNASEHVHAIEIVVRKPAGSGDIDLSAVFVQVLSADGVDRIDPSSTAFTVTALQDDDSSLDAAPMIMNSQVDRARLDISLSAIQAEGGENAPWEPGGTATLRLDVGGRVTVLHLRVPRYVGDSSTVDL